MSWHPMGAAHVSMHIFPIRKADSQVPKQSVCLCAEWVLCTGTVDLDTNRSDMDFGVEGWHSSAPVQPPPVLTIIPLFAEYEQSIISDSPTHYFARIRKKLHGTILDPAFRLI